MSVELIHPDGMLEQSDYAPVAVGTGPRIVLLAGQAGVTADFQPAAPDLAGQTFAALNNIVIGVQGAGGEASDIARLTVYVVDWTVDKWDDILIAVTRAQAELGLATPAPPLSIIGIQALFTPDFIVEIEATAILG